VPLVEFDKPQETTYADPAHPGNLSPTNLLPWQKNVSTQTHEAIGNEINAAENIQNDNQGVNRAEQAASAIMNGGSSPGLSRALSQRASTLYATNKAQNRLSLSQDNVVRQQRSMARIGSQLNSIEKLKMANAAAQLRFADQIAEYNDNLEMSKYQVLSNVIGNMGSFYGGALGNMSKESRGQFMSQLRDGISGGPKRASNGMERAEGHTSGWEDR